MTPADRAARWRHLVADLPLLIVDTETTERDSAVAEVCELGLAAFGPAEVEAAIAKTAESGYLVTPLPQWQHVARVKPTRPITPGAARVHGIQDADVAAAAGIDSLAPTLVSLAPSYRVAGYNSRAYDLPILARQAGFEPSHALDVMGVVGAARQQPELDPRGRAWTDGGPAAMLGLSSFKDKLGAVYAALTGGRLFGAHGALADVLATAEVLFRLVALYEGLPATAPELTVVAERALCMVLEGPDGLAFVRGKYEGETVRDVEMSDPGYIGWLLDADDMDRATKDAVVEAIGEGRATQILAQRRERSSTRKPRAARKPKQETAGAAA